MPPPPIDYLSQGLPELPAGAAGLLRRCAIPNWVERSEADFGMMMSELLSAVGDELSYLQDRVAAEATLRDGDAAALAGQPGAAGGLRAAAGHQRHHHRCNAMCRATGTVPAGARISALAPDGTPVPFEIGAGLADATNYPVVRSLELSRSRPTGSTTTSNAGRRARPICGCRDTASTSPPARRC